MNLDASIAEIDDGTMLDKLLKRDERDHYGWFWQLREIPDAAQSRYLYHLLAGHDFQEGLKNYRDLAFLGGTLARWQDSIVAFDDMLATRERAYAERVPQADAVLASGRLDKYGAERVTAGGRLDEVEASQDVAALGTPEERDQWARIVRLESALLTAPNDEETNVIREKTRLAKGVLYWRLAESFKARVWNERRTLKDLDQSLREAQNRWVRVQKARGSMPNNTGDFAARVAALAFAARRRADAPRRRRATAERAARKPGAQRAGTAEGTHRARTRSRRVSRWLPSTTALPRRRPRAPAAHAGVAGRARNRARRGRGSGTRAAGWRATAARHGSGSANGRPA